MFKFIFLFLFSFPVFAETYPMVEPSTFSGECSAYSSRDAMCAASYSEITGPWTADGQTSCKSPQGYSNYSMALKFRSCVIDALNTYGCPGGGVLINSACYGAPDCPAPQVRNFSTGLCGYSPSPPDCAIGENPLTNNCKLPIDKGNAINCPDGSSVYPPMICASTGSRWDGLLPDEAYKPMCSPLATDLSMCQPLLFQRFDDVSDIIGSLAGLATVALSGIPELVIGSELATIVGGVAIEGRALWNGFFHNSAGEIVEFKVQGDVPSSVYGNAVSEYVKNNPASSFSAEFTEKYNVKSPDNPIIIDSNTGVIRPGNSSVPLSGNQVAEALRELSADLVIPVTDFAPYIQPESIPWVAEAVKPLTVDILHQHSPVNYPNLLRPVESMPSSTPYYNVSPNPFSSSAPLVVSFPPQPLVFTPDTPEPVVWVSPPSVLPPTYINPNPLGTDAPVVPPPPIDPNLPIDPNAIDPPPTPPDIYPDTWKYFDWLPMQNPLHFDPSSFLPELPEPSCTYEVHSSFHVPFLGVKHFDLAPCERLQPLRAVLGWVFSILTVFSCFFLITRSSF
jgi:hypothetical protein